LELAKETRPLSIEPGGYDDKIICSLFQHEYEALSYVWGNALSNRGVTDMDVEILAVVYEVEKKTSPCKNYDSAIL
jgi:hypothetical protein